MGLATPQSALQATGLCDLMEWSYGKEALTVARDPSHKQWPMQRDANDVELRRVSDASTLPKAFAPGEHSALRFARLHASARSTRYEQAAIF